MLGKFVLWFSLAALVLIAAITISCGSSSSTKSKACTTGPFNVVGDWQITINDTGGDSTTGLGAIDSAGLALFFDGSGDTLQLPAITGACSFTGSITAYAAPNSVPPGDPTVVVDSAEGNVTSDNSITGTFSGAAAGTISATTVSPLTGDASALTGPMVGEIPGISDFLFFDVSATTGNSMSFTGSDSLGCTIGGTFTQSGTGNVFDVSYTYSGDGCTATTSTGIGFESDTDYFNFNDSAETTYFYATILDTTNGPYVIEMFPGCGECARKKSSPRHGSRWPMLPRMK